MFSVQLLALLLYYVVTEMDMLQEEHDPFLKIIPQYYKARVCFLEIVCIQRSQKHSHSVKFNAPICSFSMGAPLTCHPHFLFPAPY